MNKWVCVYDDPAPPWPPATAASSSGDARASDGGEDLCIRLPFYSFPPWVAEYLQCAKCRAALEYKEPYCMCIVLSSMASATALTLDFSVRLVCHTCANPFALGCTMFPRLSNAVPLLKPVLQRLWHKFPPIYDASRLDHCYVCETRGGRRLCATCVPAMALLKRMDPEGFGEFPKLLPQSTVMLDWCNRVYEACRKMQNQSVRQVAYVDIWASLRLPICYASLECKHKTTTKICKCHAIWSCKTPACLSSVKERHHCPGMWFQALDLRQFLLY